MLYGLEHFVLAGPLVDLTMRDGVQNDFHVAIITDALALTNQRQSIDDYINILERYAQTVTNLEEFKRLSAAS